MDEKSFKHDRRSMLMLAAALGMSAWDHEAEAATAPPPTGSPSLPPALSPALLVDRAFVRLAEGPVHYRWGGEKKSRGKRPLFLAHAGPGSSSSFASWIPELSKDRFVIAPDMLGNGDSAPPASRNTDMAYYVDAAIRIMDTLGLGEVDFYGNHTGAQIGCQMAVTHPGRIRRLVLNGIPLFTDDFRQQLLDNYAPEITPDAAGGHMLWVWQFIQNQSLFWPHFARDAAHRQPNGLPSPESIHAGTVDVLKSLSTYHIAYRAAFRQDVRSLLPKLKIPTLLIAAERDPLHLYLDEAASLVPHAEKALYGLGSPPSERLARVKAFFAA